MHLPAFQTLAVEVRGAVLEVAVSRPKALNALNRQVLDELNMLTEQLRATEAVRCVILTGAGDKAFVAGADIAQMATMSPDEAQEFSQFGQRVFLNWETLPMPTIAAVNGFALGGGCELALACDMIYASTNAKFGQPEVKLGLMPGFGGCVRLAQKAGLAVASEWVFSGDMYSADVARQHGVVHAVVALEELMATVRTLAETIAKRAPLAVRSAKRVMLSVGHDLAASYHAEQHAFGELFATEDMKLGTQAFLAKAKAEPTFAGR